VQLFLRSNLIMQADASSARSPSLRLRIDNEAPISALDYGKLLEALSQDFRTITEHDLVITRVEAGSIITILQDATAVLATVGHTIGVLTEAAVALKKFYQATEQLVSELKGKHSGKEDTHATGPEALNTVERIARTAIDAKANVSIEYADPHHSLRVLVGANEGPQLLKEVKARRKRKRKERKLAENIEVSPEIDSAMEALTALPDMRIASPVERATARVLIEAFIRTLERANQIALARVLLNELRQVGRHDLVEMAESITRHWKR
jgi:hypothetical protein